MFLDEEFADASAGYLNCPASGLPYFEALLRSILERRGISLGVPTLGRSQKFGEIRYRSIYHAVCWGIRNPAAWDLGREPVTLNNRPKGAIQ